MAGLTTVDTGLQVAAAIHSLSLEAEELCNLGPKYPKRARFKIGAPSHFPLAY